MPPERTDLIPFHRDDDAQLCRLIQTLRAALDPDVVELDFSILPHGHLYQRQLLTNGASVPTATVSGLGDRASAARAPEPSPLAPAGESRPPDTPLRGADGSAPDPLTLCAPFEAEGLLRGTLRLFRVATRPWTCDERTRFELLRPLVSHLLEAVAKGELDAGARRCLDAAAQRSAVPILVLSLAGEVLFANEAARSVVSPCDGEAQTVLSGGYRQTSLLCELKRLACAETPPARGRLVLSGGGSLEAHIARVEGGEGQLEVRVVTLHEKAALTIEDVRPHLLGRGVSGREAEVVCGVLQGLRNAEIAAELFISEYTVKDHLKHVFQKLGVESRGGLIRALYALPVGLSAPRNH